MKTSKLPSRSKQAALIASGTLLLGSTAALSPLTAQASTDPVLTATSSAPLNPASVAAAAAPVLECANASQDATCTLSLRLPGTSPFEPAIELSVAASAITSSSTGYHLSGDVTIKSPQGDIPLTNVDLLVTLDSSSAAGIASIQGTATLPFPKLGFLKNAGITQNATALIGMDSGANLANLGAHLNPDRNYLLFHFDQGLSGTVGPMKITAPGGHSATFVLDPSDPYFYIGGSGFAGEGTFGVEFCETEEDCAKTGEDYGFGISLNGLIPFEADPALPFADELADMKGHLVLDGTIPLGDLPLSISGTAVVNIDTDKDGVTFFDSPLGAGGIPTNALGIDTKLAAKGTLDVSIPFLKVFETGIQLAEGTVLVNNSKFEKSVYFNGIQDVGSATLPIIPKYLPLTQETVLNVTGHFLIDTTNFATPEGRQQALESMKEGYLVASGNFGYDASNLGALAGVDLGNLAVASAQLTLDKHGFALAGQTTSRLPIPHVGFSGNVHVNLDIPADDINASALSLQGDLNVAGVPLGKSSLKVDSRGAAIRGQIDAVLGKIDMSGSVTRSSVNLSGSTGVYIPLSKFADVLGPQIKRANGDLQNALDAVDRLNSQIDQQRQIVKAEHDRVAAQLQNAQRAVNTAQTSVNILQAQINAAYGTIRRYRSEIASWQRWYDRQPWYNKSWAWTKLGYEVGWRGTAIGGLYTYIGGLEASKATALGTLRGAQLSLAGINTVVLSTPIDADPRVAGLIGSLKIAQETLRTAQAVVNALPKLGDFSGSTTVTINNDGLSGTISGNYTFTVNGRPVSAGVSGRVIAAADQFKACLDIPGASGVCVAL
ncbi:hypothetical protein [Methylococcus sp. EFPC2]|uniref:hypothetical protein n=1 Tax=Methylococcus sp. EFPC2 TaxID=2812648 RepID=UPI001966E6BD|nr:hypothetical protein [Methylococcus sp. EFPC2]QSA95847.1 hypothetical protein JWZ97_11405 [Methylococcus sp. EFPC2]